MLRRVLTGSAAPAVTNNQGQTALMLAAREGMLLVVRRLLHCHVPVLGVDLEGKTVLRYAMEASLNQMDVVCAVLGIKRIPAVKSITKKCTGSWEVKCRVGGE